MTTGSADILRRWQGRLRLASVLDGVSAGMIALAATAAVAPALRLPAWGIAGGALLGMGLAVFVVVRAWDRWSPMAVAGFVEARVPGLDNLVVSAVQMRASPDGLRSALHAEVEQMASERAATVDVASVLPLGRSAARCAVVTALAALVTWAVQPGEDAGSASGIRAAGRAPAAIAHVRIAVMPPDYRALPPAIVENVDAIAVPEGSRVRIEVTSERRAVWMEQPAGATPLAPVGEGLHAVEWQPVATATLVLAAGATLAQADETRLLVLSVIRDEEPRVRITTPGRDLAFATAAQTVPVTIEADDAEGLQALELRYVKLSGSGEAFTFDEGRVPLDLSRVSPGRWVATARWSLARLALEDGDAVAYRALVRDTRPGREWVSSDSYTIDIGRRLEFASAGFAIPEDDRRYAISQQMVIIRTEQLDAGRAQWSADEWEAQTKSLAIEQRMVRSEVVFLSGGEVQDEVEEAEHSHEVQEGRLENTGRAEMLRAINDMSRAEALLNGGDTRGALAVERSALAALQRAFDRRRYFLRTLPERSRIDLSRRLSGDGARARPFDLPVTEPPPDAATAERALAATLAAVVEGRAPVTAGLISRVADVDPADERWRSAAAALSSASGRDAEREAAAQALADVAARVRQRLAPAGGWAPRPDALDGWWADELRRRR